MRRGDEETLLHELRAALVSSPMDPADEGVQRVRARAEAGRRLMELERRRGHAQRALLVAAALVCLLAFASGVVFATDIPTPVRAALHSAGLPVESPELVEARAVLHDLGVALGEQGPPEVIQESDARMLELVEQLDKEEQEVIVPVAHEVHLRAVEYLGNPPSGR
ncbi:MAG: hypothetical protein ACR2I4_11580 [Actinomycetota bacterium]|jgi:hypothetical protein|nr:hypothetical protein [Actinomycetota bacterium]MDQ3216467.1 hypothetical protein [Actinomycetota bacterium]